ncbi:fumarylacetoacetate hydrolase family protein [Paracoccus sp. M683]|uniref:fumarylacetoacetate hydrolase family protein n=1 Tax=Paracoccus sp. M683 TaxID=2594268 RepID=UPI00117BF088|nr:fumarylacetoacetate hydrolase family protein [Paracoccus sp. M683]TRW93039.1 fumarylacetoacetate hydrolase family protein [Paracoccus sp. M683]
MRFISFTHEGRDSYGVLTGQGICDLGARLGAWLPDLRSYLAAAEAGAVAALPQVPQQADLALADVTRLPPLPNPGKIICVGLNYEGHRLETGRPKLTHPTLFARFADTLVADGAPIIRPPESADLDFEGELAVVMGRGGRRVPAEAAATLVAGYSVFNDASLRDFQNHTHQFMPGKNFTGTGAFGPDLVTSDEAPDLTDLVIETRLNGETVQKATLDELIFKIPELIAYISAFTPLSAGDVIVTGTPGGVGFKRKPPLFMKPGDHVEVRIDQIGILGNDIKDEDIQA